MWIRNTSRHPDREVDRLVRFATEDVDMANVCVNVRNGELAGGAYNGVPEISNAPKQAEYLITLRIGTGRESWPLGPVNYHFKAPHEVGPRNRFPFYICHDWREWLVKLAAHEANHISQFREDTVCSEIECERFAIEMLERFRAAHGGEPEREAEYEVERLRPRVSERARRAGWGRPFEPRPPVAEPESEPQPDPQLELF